MALASPASTSPSSPSAAQAKAASKPKNAVTATVDGVTLSISASKLPDGPVNASEPGLPLQEASMHSTKPYYSLAITAVPFGKMDSWDFAGLGPAKAGDAAAWTAALKTARNQQGGTSHQGPSATLFGTPLVGIASTPSIPLDGIHYEKVDMVEWVAETGDRIYLVQLSQEHNHPVAGFGTKLAISATSPNAPTTIGRVIPASQQAAQADIARSHATTPAPKAMTAMSMSLASLGSTLPAPSWWDGTICDTHQNTASLPLTTATVRGVQACGPLPETLGDSGTWGGISEWQCTELSERYMYLAGYISGQYAGNGGQLVANFPGTGLTAENSGAGPTSPALGDVVSMGTTHVEGHTALVLANHVNSSGNGYITILQQNFTSNGSGTMNVVNGALQSEESGYTASWLHDPRNDAPPPPPPAPAVPTAIVTTPTASAFVGGSVTVTAAVSDTTSGASFSTQFYVDGTTAIGSPQAGVSPSVVWASTGVADGSHTITAVSTATVSSVSSGSGTSPGVAVTVRNNFTLAFQANNGQLYVESSGGSVWATAEGMMSGTSPAIAALPGGGYVMAFQSSGNVLYVESSTGALWNTSEGMLSATSPAIG